MIIAKHPDGRILLMASELGLRPTMLKQIDETWHIEPMPRITGSEVDEFKIVTDPKEREDIVLAAKTRVVP